MKLINISGQPREYYEKGFIYEFPFPSNNPTQVPDEVGKRLLVSGHYEEIIIKTKKINEKKEVDDDGI